jgi:hypothetical protein
MPIADEVGARRFAQGYLEWIKPRWATLVGPNTTLVYSVEILREEFRVADTALGARIGKKAAVSLCNLADTDPYAYLLFKELRGHGRHLTGTGAATILTAGVKQPRAQGNRERNGARDLVLSILWVALQDYGLPKENKVRVGNRPVTPSIGTVISQEMRRVLGVNIEPRTILAAVMNQTEN